jgi:hypothetical protein
MPFFLLDGVAKLDIINHLKSNGTLFLHIQGYFKNYISHMFLRNSLTVIYLIGIIIFFFKFVKFNGFLPFLENKVLLWKVLFLFYMLFTFAIPPLIALLKLTPYSAENFYLILF